jgi:O-antigen biosynthesis protein
MILVDRFNRLYRYWRQHGTAAVWRLFLHKLAGDSQPGTGDFRDAALSDGKTVDASQISLVSFQNMTPLRGYHLSGERTRCVCIVTDSINNGSMFAGVGTALIFAALLANKLNAQLRVITRTERARVENLEHLLSVNGIELKQEVEFRFAAFYDRKYQLDMIPDDLFITTSWWTTAATLPRVPVSNIIYMLQEDERNFYPYGDERLKCESVLRNRDIRFLINTRLLFDSLIQNNFDNIARRGMWFEPAFPVEVFHPRKNDRRDKRRFFFYARPNNFRNLFNLGIEVIEEAIRKRVLDMDRWEIFLVGKDIRDIIFHGGYVPQKCENMTWSEYADLAGTIDLGLVLMYSPHPSYPPLDLVASGAVVVTNRFANKTDLSSYSPNVICADLDRDALVESLRHAVVMAVDPHVRERNFHKNNLHTNWHEAFAEALNQLSGDA